MHSNFHVLFYTSLALVAFAANSVLCRMALGAQEIDAMSFTIIRLVSGSVMLIFLVAVFEPNSIKSLFRLHNLPSASNNHSSNANIAGSNSFTSQCLPYCLALLGPLSLFVYAAGFSYAYITLDTGIGALILFAVVQITMILMTVIRGSRLNVGEWVGLIIGFAGFVYLLYPSLTGPSLYGLILMTLAGIAWGGYTLLGQRKGTGNQTLLSPLVMTANNFVLTLPICLVWLVFTIGSYSTQGISLQGIVLSVLSGAVTSGLGYAIWYKALQYLNATRAAVSQLLVPVLASVGGLLLVNEAFTLHLAISSLVVLGGILIVVLSRK